MHSITVMYGVGVLAVWRVSVCSGRGLCTASGWQIEGRLLIEPNTCQSSIKWKSFPSTLPPEGSSNVVKEKMALRLSPSDVCV